MSFVRSLALILMTLLPAGMAFADPVGTWRVRGVNPDTGSEYTGTVRVNRTGDTYSVFWKIGGTEILRHRAGRSDRQGSL